MEEEFRPLKKSGNPLQVMWQDKESFLKIFAFTFLIIGICLWGLYWFFGDSVDEFMTAKNNNFVVDNLADQPFEVRASEIDRIVADQVGIDASIFHPESKNVTVLDEYLKKGAVYYPGSGTPSEGNVFIFGHSTNWPVVRNQAYKTFNNLEKLSVGDEIVLESSSTNKRYVYKVTKVLVADENEIFVNFKTDNPMLTVSTCNTFGAKQERNVVEAELIRTE